MKLVWEKGLKPLWDAFKEAFGQIAMLVGDVLNVILPILGVLLDLFGAKFKVSLTVFSGAVATAFNIALGIIKTAFQVIEGVFKGLRDIFNGFITFLTGIFTLDWKKTLEGVAQILKGIFGTLFAVLSGPFVAMYNTIKAIGEGMVWTLKTGATRAWEGIKSVFGVVGSWFETTFSKAWTKVKDVFSSGGKIFDGIKDGIASTFKTVVNGLIGGINRIIATPFNAINGMLNTIRSVSVAGFSPFKSLWGYNPLSVPSIPKLARGGILDGGGALFQAGEFGKAEMIGSYGGKTTVMPLENTDFVDAMYNAVFNAVTASMGSGGNQGGDIVLRVGEYELGKASLRGIQRVNRMEGRLEL